ncbi:MAG: hypothetical protein RIR55_848 [Bacteroidota bacterium]|jgi:hypothetical protein
MKGVKLLIVLVVIFLINIALTGFLEITVKRPIIYYEYLLLPTLLLLINKHWLRVSVFMGLILLDFTFNLSHLYYFDLFNYLEKLPSLFISKFSFSFWILSIVGLAVTILLFNYLIKIFEKGFANRDKHWLRNNVLITISIFAVIYIVDSLNGSTIFGNNEEKKIIRSIQFSNKTQLNIGKSLIKDIYTDYRLYTHGKKQVHEIPDFKNLNSNSSFAYRFFYNSKGEKEVLIILESWGLLKNQQLREEQIAPFFTLDSNRYQIKFDSSYFDGATVQAESRELLNKEGEAYFSVINQNKCDIKGLIQKKNEANYNTMAVQSFPGSYSLGNKFNALIGFQKFKEFNFFHDTLGFTINQNNHYTSVNDEEVFSYVFNNTPKNQKSFTFCLTINTHLPFRLSQSQTSEIEFLKFKQKYTPYFPSEQTLGRYYRMKQELKYLAALIKNSTADRILIIGDHAPPFIFKEERKLYLPNLVPALFIEKR